MPVVALNGRAEASCVTVPAVMLYGKLVAERDHGAMTLIEQARSALDLAEARDVALVRTDAVAVRLGGVGRLRQRVADRRVHASSCRDS